MSNPIIARLSRVDNDDDDDEGVRLSHPATGTHSGSTHSEAERSCNESAARPVATPFVNRQNLALSSLPNKKKMEVIDLCESDENNPQKVTAAEAVSTPKIREGGHDTAPKSDDLQNPSTGV
ncbi:hypothetical protein KCU77_g1694, partial [Aureobasidium melanogenum]